MVKTYLENIPKEFIEKYKECDDSKILHRMAVKLLYQIASNPCQNRISKELEDFERSQLIVQ